MNQPTNDTRHRTTVACAHVRPTQQQQQQQLDSSAAACRVWRRAFTRLHCRSLGVGRRTTQASARTLRVRASDAGRQTFGRSTDKRTRATAPRHDRRTHCTVADDDGDNRRTAYSYAHAVHRCRNSSSSSTLQLSRQPVFWSAIYGVASLVNR